MTSLSIIGEHGTANHTHLSGQVQCSQKGTNSSNPTCIILGGDLLSAPPFLLCLLARLVPYNTVEPGLHNHPGSSFPAHLYLIHLIFCSVRSGSLLQPHVLSLESRPKWVIFCVTLFYHRLLKSPSWLLPPPHELLTRHSPEMKITKGKAVKGN